MLIFGCLILLLTTFSVVWTRAGAEEQATNNGQQTKAKLEPTEANAETLVYVQVAWRHGDRTPASSVPFYDASAWEEGLGELTMKGIGLFPPSKSETWDADLPWQPVPVHSVPKTMDKELYEDIDCPAASSEFSKVWDSTVVRKMVSENEDLIKYLGEKSQIPDFNLDKLWMVYDNLFCMLQHMETHKWPSWINDSIFDRVQKLYDGYSRTKYHTDVLRRLRGGPLLKDILDRFVAKVNGALGIGPKLFAYSAHDTTLAAMLSSLGIYPTVFPRYSSAVLLELHRKDGKLVVQVFHKNETDVDDLYRYEIPGCGDPCTLDALRLAVDRQHSMFRYLPTDWTTECGLAGLNVVNYMGQPFPVSPKESALEASLKIKESPVKIC
ncbi:unnamed protein product [Angiostrongylus costaricensis]|uniref:Lysosomal acid phosphatase n=1 Tax=Angiostrongylus costaricensis TaxID=334426 RepID=A0A0R3PBW6_ANGCS|nr:unnamed protein product [Angiostrongylus costaricensis]